ncbi:Prestin [Aphelenchoides besseyi]|nr:Prestin [Aphelenchoides besseyi]
MDTLSQSFQPMAALGARRTAMNQDEFDIKFNFLASRRHSTESAEDELPCFKLRSPFPIGDEIVFEDKENEQLENKPNVISELLPILQWLPKYMCCQQLRGDLFAGFCLGLNCIAEGLSYSFLAGLSPICGLYTAVVSVLFYALLGTSKFSLLSTNLILCFMVRNCLERLNVDLYDYRYRLSDEDRTSNDSTLLMEYVCTLTLTSTLTQLVLHLLRLEFVFALLSKQMIAGLSFGFALRSCISQIPHIFYIHESTCQWSSSIKLTIAFWKCLEYMNLYTVSIVACAVLSIIFVRQVLSFLFSLHKNQAIPYEFLLLIISSALSYLFDVHQLYGVVTCKNAGNRFQFVVPQLKLLPTIWLDGLVLGIFSYALHFNITSAVSKRYNYNLIVRQVPGCLLSKELISITTIATVGSLFGGFVSSQSQNRNKTLVNAGASSLLSNLIILPLLIVSIVFADVLCAYLPVFHMLSNVSGSGAYAERCWYASDYLEESGIAIGRFEASLLYHNVHKFRQNVLETCTKIKGQLLGVGLGTRSGSMKSNNTVAFMSREMPVRSTLLISGDIVPNYDASNIDQTTRVMILDFSSIPEIDVSGLEIMRDLFEELSEHKIRLLFAAVNAGVRNRFKVFGGFDIVSKQYFFPSVHDAVLCAQQMGCGIIAPGVHMSVSMNGCRDLIALSNATSSHDFMGHYTSFIQPQTSGSRSITHQRPSLSDNKALDPTPQFTINVS